MGTAPAITNPNTYYPKRQGNLLLKKQQGCFVSEVPNK